MLFRSGFEGTQFYFDIAEGTLLCGECAAAAGKQPNITGSQLAAVQHILYASDAKAYSFTLPPEQMLGLSRLASDYAVRQLDHRSRTLDFLRTVLDC